MATTDSIQFSEINYKGATTIDSFHFDKVTYKGATTSGHASIARTRTLRHRITMGNWHGEILIHMTRLSRNLKRTPTRQMR